MLYFSDIGWWLLLIFSSLLGIGLAFREAFRRELLMSPAGKFTTYSAAFALPLWIGMLILMGFHSGIVSALIGSAVSILAAVAALLWFRKLAGEISGTSNEAQK
jgi:hypothetical protein